MALSHIVLRRLERALGDRQAGYVELGAEDVVAASEAAGGDPQALALGAECRGQGERARVFVLAERARRLLDLVRPKQEEGPPGG